MKNRTLIASLLAFLVIGSNVDVDAAIRTATNKVFEANYGTDWLGGVAYKNKANWWKLREAVGGVRDQLSNLLGKNHPLVVLFDKIYNFLFNVYTGMNRTLLTPWIKPVQSAWDACNGSLQSVHDQYGASLNNIVAAINNFPRPTRLTNYDTSSVLEYTELVFAIFDTITTVLGTPVAVAQQPAPQPVPQPAQQDQQLAQQLQQTIQTVNQTIAQAQNQAQLITTAANSIAASIRNVQQIATQSQLQAPAQMTTALTQNLQAEQFAQSAQLSISQAQQQIQQASSLLSQQNLPQAQQFALQGQQAAQTALAYAQQGTQHIQQANLALQQAQLQAQQEAAAKAAAEKAAQEAAAEKAKQEATAATDNKTLLGGNNNRQNTATL